MSKPCEYNYTDCIEIGQIAAILSDECLQELYDKSNLGYIDCTYAIGEWAVEFFDKYRNTDWEDLLQNPKSFGFNDGTICWDDAIMQFGKQKLNELLKRD